MDRIQLKPDLMSWFVLGDPGVYKSTIVANLLSRIGGETVIFCHRRAMKYTRAAYEDRRYVPELENIEWRYLMDFNGSESWLEHYKGMNMVLEDLGYHDKTEMPQKIRGLVSGD